MTTKDYTPWVPFDIYDFFGYLFPGVFLLVSLLAFMGHSIPEAFIWHSAIWETTKDFKFLMGLLLVVCSIVLVYTIGHFVATISSVFLDRIMMRGIEGYPILHLLALPKPSRPYSESTYKYILTFFNVILIIPVFVSKHSLLKLILITLSSILIVLIVLRIAVKLMRHYRGNEYVDQLSYRYPFDWFLTPSRRVIDPLIVMIKGVFGMDRAFPTEFIERYKSVFKKTFNMNPDNVETENYWLSYFRTTGSNISHTGVIRTWLHLYSFARNLSAASYIVSILIVWWIYSNPEKDVTMAQIQLGITVLFALVFGIRYWVLYSTYYTKSIIRSFLTTEISGVETRQQ